jgi:predicted dehydrogenase
LTAAATVQAKAASTPARIDRKLKVGIVGCGGRGSWIAGLFQEHGGYQFVAAADYFPDRAEKTGASLGAEKSKCFSGLSGYKRLIESSVEAVILETPPCFFPQHAAAAVEAGLHVFMAKPVAVDVPGTLEIGTLAETAAKRKQVFLVDYQMPTDPVNIEVRKRLQQGALGDLQMVFSVGKGGGGDIFDQPLGRSIENRLTGQIWVNDDALGCGHLGNFDVHIVDALTWALDRRPVAAYGRGSRCRRHPCGDSLDTYCVTYTFAGGLTWCHQGANGPTHDWLKQVSLEGSIQGKQAAARLAYWGKAYIRGGRQHFAGGAVADLYDAGPKRNIAAFYENVRSGNFGNETARRSVGCTLTCILGREAARRGGFLTMDEIVKENKRLEVDLSGLRT